ncbi:hypothetical protein IW150_004009 [Coemansia sp. RSA 2607]|nr:hypothetical protein IW150_004009 [Coemansia sp. RSA 2607]
MHVFSRRFASIFALAVAATSSFAVASNSTSELSRRLVNASTQSTAGLDYIVYVSTGYPKAGIQGCTGVLIAPKFVLTTQACIDADPNATDNDYTIMEVTVGKTTGTSGTRSLKTFSVANAYSSTNFAPVGYYNHIALLELADEVPSGIATPVKIFASDSNTDIPSILVGYSATSAQDSAVSLDTMEMAKLIMDSSDYCSDALDNFNRDTEMCSRLMAGLNTCRVDYGAPVLTPVDTGSSTTYALLGLTTYSYKDKKYLMNCVYGGQFGFYTWIYPFIEQLSSLTNMPIDQLTISNVTKTEPSSSSSSSSSSKTSSTSNKTTSTTSKKTSSTSKPTTNTDAELGDVDENGGNDNNPADNTSMVSIMEFVISAAPSVRTFDAAGFVALVSVLAVLTAF